MRHDPVVIVEDSDADFYAMRRVLKKVLPCEIVRCCTGNEALDYLFRRGTHAEAAAPSLILLDLNLPGKDGRSILAQVKQDKKLCTTPVVIVSTSDNPADLTYCYTNGCSGYVVKELSFERFSLALQTLSSYWFTAVTLPQA